MATKPQRDDDEVLKASAASPKPFRIADPTERLNAENANYQAILQAKQERFQRVLDRRPPDRAA